MATMKNGLLRGRVGLQVFYVRGGVQCVRALPKKKRREKSEATLNHLAKMKVLSAFLAPLKAIIRHTCKPAGAKMTGMNRAIQQAYNDAIRIEQDDPVVDPALVKVSRGGGIGLLSWQVEVTNSTVRVQWEASLFNPYHQIFLVAYNIEAQQVQLSKGDAMMRDGILVVPLEEEILGSIVHLYAYASDRLGKTFSDSQYLGSYQV